MTHSSEQTWGVMSNRVSGVCDNVLTALISAEENYQDMLEVYSWAGSTDTRFANLLFAGDPDLTTATQDEIDKATDLKDAMVAVHQLYQAMTNVAVTTSDRAASLRRMS